MPIKTAEQLLSEAKSQIKEQTPADVMAMQKRGASLAEAYRRSLDFTGRVVALVGLTMAAGVITWAWSPIKFQADMGILLTFMFLWNMLGALILIPALSHFLLNDRREPVVSGMQPITAA